MKANNKPKPNDVSNAFFNIIDVEKTIKANGITIAKSNFDISE